MSQAQTMSQCNRLRMCEQTQRSGNVWQSPITTFNSPSGMVRTCTHIDLTKLGLRGLLTEPIWTFVFVLIWYVWPGKGWVLSFNRNTITALVLYSNLDFVTPSPEVTLPG